VFRRPADVHVRRGNGGHQVGELARSARKMVEAQVASQAKYDYDGCVIDFDDASLAEACGARVIYRDEEPAIVDEAEPVVKDWSDIDTLTLPDPWRDARLPVWLDATRLLVDRMGKEVWIMGRADQGPFSLACLLRGSQQFMVDLMEEENHPHLDRLIDFCRRRARCSPGPSNKPALTPPPSATRLRGPAWFPRRFIGDLRSGRKPG